MSSFKERLLSLWPDLSVARISGLIGMSHMGVSRVFREGTLPKADTLLSIHEQSGCDLKWLMTGEGEPFPGQADKNERVAQEVASKEEAMSSAISQKHQVNHYYQAYRANPSMAAKTAVVADEVLDSAVASPEFVTIPRYYARVGAGRSYCDKGEPSESVFSFQRRWVEHYLHAYPQDLSVIAVRDDSMAGVVDDGDDILVNHAKNQPGNGLYVIRIGESLMVKRTQPLPDNKLLVTSANEAYKPFTLDMPLAEGVEIVGKVEWSGRRF